MKRILSLVLAAVLVLGLVPATDARAAYDPENFTGLVVTTDSANKLNLYGGIWAQGTSKVYSVVEPDYTETVDGITYRYYQNAKGGYHVRASRSGYIALYKNIYMTDSEAASVTYENITLDKKGTAGFVPQTIYSHSTEVLENEASWKSDSAMFPKYAAALDIPVFTAGRDPHQMTTNQELWADIRNQDKPDDDMYVFTLGQSGDKGYDIPLVIFTKTDLSAATTMEQAARLMDDDKLTVYYRAQMHGNEPAGTEGALAMIHRLQDGYGEEILDKLDLVIVPRLGMDSSALYQRLFPNSINPNRDQMRIESAEMYAFQKGYLLFDPEIVLDGHERVWNNNGGDIQVSACYTPMNSDAFRSVALQLDDAAFRELEANDLCGYYYAGCVNEQDPNMGGGYYAAAGSIYVLMESRGIHGGNESMERRAVAHMAAVTGMLDYLCANDQAVKELVAAEREAVCKRGETYEDTDVFVLQTGSRTTTEADKQAWGTLNTARQTMNWGNGSVTFPTNYPSVKDVVKRSRVLPTAYVLSAELPNIRAVLKRMDDHGITYRYLPAGATLPLQRYSGTATEATLSAPRTVRFAEGCYVFTMNQERGLLLAAFLEPDHTNSAEYSGNLVQMDLLEVADTYRYSQDLTEGAVDYTVTDATFVDATVYLDGTNGLDTADGLTEATAVKTLEQAYKLLEEAMRFASADSRATVTVVGLYDLGAQQVHLPAVDFPVTIQGKTTADGFSFTGGSGQDLRTLELHGDTTFQNMRLHINNSQTFNFLVANGYKLVLGEDLNTTTNKANCYFTVAGGAYGYTASTASADLTVRSGSWRTIYAGGYRASVNGSVRADISGCYVYQNIAPTYMGSIVEDVQMHISQVEVDDAVATSAIYAAPITTNSDYNIGKIRGDVTLTLGSGIDTRAVYMASREGGEVIGTVTVIPLGIALEKIFAKCDTTTGMVIGRCIQLTKDVTEDITWDSQIIMDLAGHHVTGKVTVEGTLLVKDSATDDYTVADGVYGKLTGQVTGKVEPVDFYMTVDNQTFHKLSLNITGVAIRPRVNGMYYEATYLCDEMLAAHVKDFGVATSIVNMPGDSYEADTDTLYTVIPGAQFVSGKAFTGAMITDVLKAGQDNDIRGKMPVYAVCYINFDNNYGWTSVGVDLSLYDVMHRAEEFAYDADLEAFYDTWKDTMEDWDFVRLGK